MKSMERQRRVLVALREKTNDLEPSGMIDEDLLGALGLAGE